MTETATSSVAAAAAAPAPLANALLDLSSEKEFDDLLRSGARSVIHCWAPWAAPCVQVNAVLDALRAQHDGVTFARVQVEQHPALVGRFHVRDVPHLLFASGGRVVRVQTGADVAGLTRSAAWLADATDDALLTAACETLVRGSQQQQQQKQQQQNRSSSKGGGSDGAGEIVVLMKGVPSSPRCPFSRQTVEALRSRGVVFRAVDVLGDGEVRERMKEVAAWETYPMVFARGRFVGGVDVITRLAEEGRLVSELARGEGDAKPAARADDALQADERSDMGAASTDGSQTATTTRTRTTAGTARTGTSTSGAGKGGDGDEAERERVRRRMEGLSKKSEVVIFMKGVPDQPRCGFSRRLVATLREQKVGFEWVDVLSDNEVRQGMKAYSKWPTFPQVYAQGRFVGGLDVVNELVEMGELRTELGL